MFKIKFTKSICILSVLFLFSSCVSNNFAVRGKSPSWVTDTEHEYSKNNLCAVGIASSQEEANSMAISNIGKIIKQKIESEITVVNSESMSSKGNSELTSSINQIVKTSALIDSLVGVEIAETWKDKDGNSLMPEDADLRFLGTGEHTTYYAAVAYVVYEKDCFKFNMLFYFLV